jgi:hypothetical protein
MITEGRRLFGPISLVSSVIPSNMNNFNIYSYKRSMQSYTCIIATINNIQKIIFIEKPTDNRNIGNLQIFHMENYCKEKHEKYISNN